MQAENEVDGLKSWDDVYRAFKRFAHCDSGAIAEGYSDAVGRLLGEWQNFSKAAELTHSDIHFKRFVIDHLNETIPHDVGEKIYENVRMRCPAEDRKLCEIIDCKLTLTEELADPAPQKMNNTR